MIKVSEIAALFLQAYRDRWGYIWGKYGQQWTKKNQEAMNKTTSAKYATARKYGARWIGHRVADCSGLLRWAMLQFDVKIQHSSNAIWKEYCKKQGKLMNGKRADGYAIRPGTAVFLCDKSGNRHHVGAYVGGKCVEAKGTQWGVVESDLSRWDEWGELKEVDYSEYPDTKEREAMDVTLRKGDRGEDVKRLQALLNKYGYKLKEDGVFGSGTEQAVRAFQQGHYLTPDGVVGPKTWAALKGENKPADGGSDDAENNVPPDTLDALADARKRLYEAIEIINSIMEGENDG